MKVLVTGATSGLGRNAVEWLLQAGHQVHATGRNAGVGDMLAAQGAQFTALDLASADIAACRALVAGCDAVWHCAANQQPWGDYQSFYDINVMATENLLQAAGKRASGALSTFRLPRSILITATVTTWKRASARRALPATPLPANMRRRRASGG